ncbi:MAG TPA: GxxExxY protein [Verrucomicrobiales bacterium]|nr:GxxExxY protein [Verrucomicrobiales bacterium]
MQGVVDPELLVPKVLSAAYAVHTHLGPGLTEKVYEACLAQELRSQGVAFEVQVDMPVEYRGTQLGVGYRVDLLIEGVLIVELKAVEVVLPLHYAQALTYLRLARRTLGLLINFNVPHLKEGIRRIVLNHPENRQGGKGTPRGGEFLNR